MRQNLVELFVMRLSKILVTALTVVPVALLADVGEPASSTAALSLAPVVKQEVPSIQVLDGTVDAVNQTTVSAQTSGQVTEILYDVDDFVDEGAVIVRLRAKEQQASLAETQANLAEAQARVNQAQQNYDRIKDIFERKLVAKSQLDNASAELKAARARLSAVKAGLEKASEQVEYTQVRAPYSGIVTQRHVELGEFVNVGSPLMTGLSLEKLRIDVDVPQHLINQVRKFKEAMLILDGPEQQAVPVESLTFFPYADPQARTFKVRVNLGGKAKDLFPGMFVKVGFVVGEETRLVVPESAVVHRGEVTAVYVVDSEQRPRLRQVRLGETHQQQWVVLAGLDEGEQVALDPIQAGIALKRDLGQRHE
jgi:RND family efflux transporter MFP subunit